MRAGRYDIQLLIFGYILLWNNRNNKGLPITTNNYYTRFGAVLCTQNTNI